MGRPSSVSNVLVRGPLGPFADAYRQALEDRSYTPLSAVNLQRQVGLFPLLGKPAGHCSVASGDLGSALFA